MQFLGVCSALNVSVGRAVTREAVGLKFKSRAIQIGHSVVNSSPLLRHFFEGAVLPGRHDAKMGTANSLRAQAYYSEYNERFDIDLMFCIA